MAVAAHRTYDYSAGSIVQSPECSFECRIVQLVAAEINLGRLCASDNTNVSVLDNQCFQEFLRRTRYWEGAVLKIRAKLVDLPKRTARINQTTHGDDTPTKNLNPGCFSTTQEPKIEVTEVITRFHECVIIQLTGQARVAVRPPIDPFFECHMVTGGGTFVCPTVRWSHSVGELRWFEHCTG